MHHEVVTFGEAMLRFSPPGFQRLEQARALDVQVGGAELNVAVALVRLGHAATWVSRLPNNALGRLLVHRVHEAGVATEHVVWSEHDRVGVYFVEFGAAPRASSVLYDRKDSAIAAIRPGMMAWERIFQGVKWFHVTGITPALSPSAADVTRHAITTARSMGAQVSIDLNYRAKLWSMAEAHRCMSALLPSCDVLIATEEDVEKVLHVRGTNYEDVAKQVLAAFPNLRVLAITLRVNPLVWRNSWTGIAVSRGQLHRTRTYEVEIVDRLGAGDAFAAGLIHGLLEGDAQKGLDYGVAVSALKHSIPGDFAWVTREEVDAVIQGGALRISR